MSEKLNSSAGMSHVVDSDDHMVWGRDVLLAWSDFNASPNPAAYEDSHSDVSYSYTWTIQAEQDKSDSLFFVSDLKLVTTFYRARSWVRQQYASKGLLSHEQGHFDLAELIGRENISNMRQQLAKARWSAGGKNEKQVKQAAKDHSARLVARHVEVLRCTLSEERARYDEITDFGQDGPRQAEFDEKFQRLRQDARHL